MNKRIKKNDINGWNEEEENILKGWADQATCYNWMHNKSHENYFIRLHLIFYNYLFLRGTGAVENPLPFFPAGFLARLTFGVWAFLAFLAFSGFLPPTLFALLM